jgi:hypothetical protein
LQERVLAAKDVVLRLQQSPKANIIHAVERVCLAYIQLANLNAESFKSAKQVKMPSTLMITQLKNLHLVAVPSMDTPVKHVFLASFKSLWYFKWISIHATNFLWSYPRHDPPAVMSCA